MFNLKLILTLMAILIGLVGHILIYNLVARRVRKERIDISRKKSVRRIIGGMIWLLVLAAGIIIWGIEVKSIWVTLLSFLALIAIGFFAVWSLLSNVLAGIIIFFAKPFKIGNDIKIIPEGIEGKVVSIGSIFTTLKFNNQIINIPNNLIMQRIIIKKIPNK